MSDETTAVLSERAKRSVLPIVRAAYRKHGRGKVIRMALMLALKDKPGFGAIKQEDATA